MEAHNEAILFPNFPAASLEGCLGVCASNTCEDTLYLFDRRFSER